MIDALWVSPGKSDITIDLAEFSFPSPSGQTYRLSMDPLRITSDTTVEQDLLFSSTRFEGSAKFNDVKLD